MQSAKGKYIIFNCIKHEVGDENEIGIDMYHCKAITSSAKVISLHNNLNQNMNTA